MSRLIDQNDSFFRIYEQKPLKRASKSSHKLSPNHYQSQEMQKIRQALLRQGQQFLECTQNDNIMRISLMQSCVVAGHRVFQVVIYDKSLKMWESRIHLVDSHGRYLKIYNVDKILFLFKEFLNRPSFPIRLSINPNNGAIRMNLTEFVPCTANDTKSLASELTTQLRTIVKGASALLIKNQQSLIEIYEISNRQLGTAKPKELPQRLRRYMNKFGVTLSFGDDDQAQSQAQLNQKLEKQSRSQLLSKHIMLPQDDRKLLSMYVQCNSKWCQPLQQAQIQFLCFQKQSIKKRIRMPGMSKCRNVYQNNYILNCIKINNYDQIRLQRITQGGFTSIYIADVQFWYVYSGSNNQVVAPSNNQNFTPDKLIRKSMIVKRQEKVHTRNRVEHQRNILKQIKGGNAVFLPKYYLSTDQNQLKEDLLSDYVTQPNLIQYVLFHKHSLSLSSKIFILFMLVQGLRYLKLFGIVHLDLKPNNIMISRTLMVKIIDFGQSYHPSICPDKHAPGFTMPYSSPQSFYPSESFSQKNDIFSIGVIAYEILYGKFPFFLFNEKTRSQIYKYKQYTNHWFYTPEELKNYGDNEVFPLLQLIFGRCLDPDPNRRPNLDWLCLMLRECIDFYQ